MTGHCQAGCRRRSLRHTIAPGQGTRQSCTAELQDIALGLALFLAQAAALVHSTDHAAQSGLHSQLCDACLSFSTIFSMAGGHGASPVLPVLVVAFPIDNAQASLVDRTTPRAFRSRAPPRR